MLHLHALKDKLDAMLIFAKGARIRRRLLPGFLPDRVRLVYGLVAEDVFAHS